MATLAPPDDPNATQGAAAASHAGLTHFLAPPQAADELGRLGKYRVLKVLGHGGMGVVFEAEDPRLRRRVAIKAMLPALAASASAGLRFMREAQAMAAVTDDHVVRIYQVDEEGGVPFLAMEFLDGEPLDRRLERSGRLPLPEVLRIGREIAEGLAAAHATGLIHRDVKPANVWLEAPNGRVKILDFGLARVGAQDSGVNPPDATDNTEIDRTVPGGAGQDASLTQQGAIVGTPAYVAPEQAGGAAVDFRCDLFALGCVLYQACTGKQPFQGADVLSTLVAVASHQPPPPARLNPAVPPGLSALVMRLLEKDTARRPASAAEVAKCLRGLEANLAPRRVRTWVALAAAAVLLAGLVGAGVFALTRPRADGGPPVERPGPSAEIQALEFIAQMKRLNPGFDGGKVDYKIEDGAVTELRFVTDNVTDISPIRVFDKLRILDMAGTHVEGSPGNGRLADLSPLEGMDLTRLTHLNLSYTKVTDAGLAHFSGCKNLRELQLGGTQVTDAGLVHFSGCKGLTLLHLNRTLVTDEGLAHFEGCEGLIHLHVDGTRVGDAGLAHFSGCKSLEHLNLTGTRVTSDGLAHFAGCKSLLGLGLGGTQVGDAGLKHLSGCKNLAGLYLAGTLVTEAGLAHLQGHNKLTHLHLEGTKVRDFSRLKGMALEDLRGDFVLERDGEVLRSLGTLKTINAKPAAEFYVSEFVAAMKRLNPGFDDKVEHRIEDGAVTELRFVTDKVTDVSPIRFFGSLRVLVCAGTATNGQGNGRLADLSPLAGMDLSRLAHLDLRWTKAGDAGMEHFKGCKNLADLYLTGTKVTNVGLAHFAGCERLKDLQLAITEVSDAGLAHFAGCKDLQTLNLISTKVSDDGLAHFAGCVNLRQLALGATQVTDKGLAHLEGCKNLVLLDLNFTKVSDAGLEHLSGCKKLETLSIGAPQVTGEGLAHLRGCKKLTTLHLIGSKVTDLSPLKGLPLEHLHCDFQPERDVPILRTIRTLETLNGNPVKEFWKEGPRGEPDDDPEPPRRKAKARQ